jgi:hypothetical protein
LLSCHRHAGPQPETLPYEIDVHAQIVHFVGEVVRHTDAPHGAVDALNLGLMCLQVILGAAAVERTLQLLELPVPVDEPPAHHPDVKGGERARQRHENCEQRDQDQQRYFAA